MFHTTMPLAPNTELRSTHEMTLTPTQRERLRAQISHAGDVVAPNWPIRTFISRNPLSGFESMTFDMAVRRAQELFGGRGILPLEEYRALHRQGRIQAADVQAAIEHSWSDTHQTLEIGGQAIAPIRVALVHLLYGINELHPNLYHWTVTQGGALERMRSDVPENIKGSLLGHVRQRVAMARPWGEDRTLAEWMARMTGIDVPRWIVETMALDRLEDTISGRRWRSGNGRQGPASSDPAGEGQAIVFPPLQETIVSTPDKYRKALTVLFDRLKTDEPVRSLSFPAFASWWMACESELVPALGEYFCGVRGNPTKFERWARILADPEAWYLKGLWLSVVNATAAADPVLPDVLRNGLPGIRKTARRSKHEGLTLDRFDFVRPLSERVSELSDDHVVEQLDEIMIRWCNAFFDEGLAHWPMPGRSRGLYRAWKMLARQDYSLVLRGLRTIRHELDRWPDRPEDAIVASLRRMEIPENHWEEYFRRHLVQLPGWVGYIRWRVQNPDQPQQQEAPVDLVDYLAVRLFYEAVLADHVCRKTLGIPGTLGAVEAYGRTHQHLLRRDARVHQSMQRVCSEAWRLFVLAQFFGWLPMDVQALSHEEVATILGWVDRFPEDRQGMIWQIAYEAGYRRPLLEGLQSRPGSSAFEGSAEDVHRSSAPEAPPARPQVQAIFCIDVRSEPFRRHLEAQAPIETIGFAGFFGVPICYQPLGSDEQAALCPVLIKPKNVVREVPRQGQEKPALRQAQGRRWSQFGQYLFHELKSHPITSFVSIDVMGWMFGIAMIGKTLFPVAFHRLLAGAKRWIQPSVATMIPVEKLSKEDIERTLDAMEREQIRLFLHRSPRWNVLESRLQPDTLDLVRRYALTVRARQAGRSLDVPMPDAEVLRSLSLSAAEWTDLIQDVRNRCGITMENREVQLDRLSAEGFTLTEQTFMVERALQLTGLTHAFARVVLWCGHGSTTENNPYAAAYDCGACGGNHGGPNARVLAAMANHPEVRLQLRDRGIVIPDDTWFLAGEHNTTTDRVELFDLDDVPVSHHPDVEHLKQALARAGLAVAQERCRRLPDAPRQLDGALALRHTLRRSVDWAQVRPEWGLSGNAAFIIGSRALTRSLDLQGRTFLHNYDSSQDSGGKVLETIMTAPLVVAEWINLQYFFSAVDPWVYGAGSKVLHNVVGGIGVMLGAHADFQQGLPLQTVRDGGRLYHEPLRLTVIIQAPPQAISKIIGQHTILQHFFHHGWLLLVAVDPDTRDWYEYRPNGEWQSLAQTKMS